MAIKVKAKKRKSKDEMQQEFEDLMNTNEDRSEVLDSKSQEIQKNENIEIVKSIENINSADIIKKFADLNIEISKILSSLSDKIVNEINLFSSAHQAVILESSELEKIHKIDVAKTSIDILIDEYNKKEDELNKEIVSQRSLWEEEQNNKEMQIKELDQNLQKTRKREEEEYEYKKNLERKKAQDKYEEERNLNEKQNNEKQEILEKNWEMREKLLKDKEEELNILRKTVDEFPLKLKNEIDKNVADNIKFIEQKFIKEIEILKKDYEAEKRIFEFQSKTFQDTIERQKEQMLSLQKQLEDAKKQVQEIAVKAIEGASGAKALSHINQIAIEQAKGRPNKE